MLSEKERANAGFPADQVEAADDSGFGATAFAGDLGCAKAIDAIKAKDPGNRRRWPAPARIEFFKQGEGGTGNGLGGRGLVRGWLVTSGRFYFNHGETLARRGEGIFYVDEGLYIERLKG